MTDFPDWQTPAANATQIAQAGVPLLAKSQQLLTLASQVIAGAASYFSPVMTVNQIGYELVVSAITAGAPAVPFAEFYLTWTDSVAGIVVEVESFHIPVSTSGSGVVIAGSGPSRADRLQVQITNRDAAVACSVNMTVLENSRVYSRTDQHWVNNLSSAAVIPGYTLARLPADSEVLGIASNAVIAAGATTTWLAGMGAGRAAVMAVNLGAAALANVAVNVWPQPSTIFGPTPVMVPSVPPADDFNISFIAPRAPLAVQIANTAASAITVSWSIVQQQ